MSYPRKLESYSRLARQQDRHMCFVLQHLACQLLQQDSSTVYSHNRHTSHNTASSLTMECRDTMWMEYQIQMNVISNNSDSSPQHFQCHQLLLHHCGTSYTGPSTRLASTNQTPPAMCTKQNTKWTPVPMPNWVCTQ